MVATMLQEGRNLAGFRAVQTLRFALSPETISRRCTDRLFLRQIPHTQPQNIVNFVCRSMQNFHGQMNVLKSEMERWEKTGTKVIMLAGGEERVDRIRRVLQDYKIEMPESDRTATCRAASSCRPSQLVVITEGEMFTQKQRKARRSRQANWKMPSGSKATPS